MGWRNDTYKQLPLRSHTLPHPRSEPCFAHDCLVGGEEGVSTTAPLSHLSATQHVWHLLGAPSSSRCTHCMIQSETAVYARAATAPTPTFLSARPAACPPNLCGRIAWGLQTLNELVQAGQWEQSVRLCRFVKDRVLWANLAVMALEARELDSAEIAYAALDEVSRGARPLPTLTPPTSPPYTAPLQLSVLSSYRSRRAGAERGTRITVTRAKTTHIPWFCCGSHLLVPYIGARREELVAVHMGQAGRGYPRRRAGHADGPRLRSALPNLFFCNSRGALAPETRMPAFLLGVRIADPRRLSHLCHHFFHPARDAPAGGELSLEI